MHDVNWWLMALAFLLGLVLTLALTIRKVTREVPVARTVSAALPKPHLDRPDVRKVAGGAVAAGAAAKLHGAADKVETKVAKVEKKAEVVHKKVADKVDDVHRTVVEKADDVHRTVVEKVERIHEGDIIEVAPYGSGSIRVSKRRVGPAGYTIKGDKDTGRYFTLDSPEYEEIEAEVWFANEESAAKAGFLRWDATGDRKFGLVAGAEAVITEKHAGGDSSLVIVDDGIAEAKTVIVDDGYADADADIVIVEGAPVRQTATVRPVAEGSASPYGKGSARAGAGGSGPAGWLIKGNEDSMLFHGPDSPYYEVTIAEVWFLDEATARAAGFDKWDKNLK